MVVRVTCSGIKKPLTQEGSAAPTPGLNEVVPWVPGMSVRLAKQELAGHERESDPQPVRGREASVELRRSVPIAVVA